jgi:hypothetical protein
MWAVNECCGNSNDLVTSSNKAVKWTTPFQPLNSQAFYNFIILLSPHFVVYIPGGGSTSGFPFKVWISVLFHSRKITFWFHRARWGIPSFPALSVLPPYSFTSCFQIHEISSSSRIERLDFESYPKKERKKKPLAQFTPRYLTEFIRQETASTLLLFL